MDTGSSGAGKGGLRDSWAGSLADGCCAGGSWYGISWGCGHSGDSSNAAGRGRGRRRQATSVIVDGSGRRRRRGAEER